MVFINTIIHFDVLRNTAVKNLARCSFIFVVGKDKVEVKNYFKHRTDCLLSRIVQCNSNKVIESFGPGRQRSLKGTTQNVHISIIRLSSAVNRLHICEWRGYDDHDGEIRFFFFFFRLQNMSTMKQNRQNLATGRFTFTHSESKHTHTHSHTHTLPTLSSNNLLL